MQRDKVEAALSSALKYLEDSLMALSTNNDKKNVSDSLWQASTETEYSVFLLSLKLGDKAEAASRKQASSSKQSIELKPALTSTLEFLKSAKASIEADNLEKGYEEAWKARNLLLKAHELLEKKRKETKKQSILLPLFFL